MATGRCLWHAMNATSPFARPVLSMRLRKAGKHACGVLLRTKVTLEISGSTLLLIVNMRVFEGLVSCFFF